MSSTVQYILTRLVVPIIAAILGVILTLGVIHLYQDHAIFHQLLNAIATQQGPQAPVSTPEAR